jgi:hypothetical protein
MKTMKNEATWALKNMVKALSLLEVLNTPEENKRLQDAKRELRRRNKQTI